MSGVAYLAAFAALAVGGWISVVAATQDRRDTVETRTMRAVPTTVTVGLERPGAARRDLEPSAFDRLVGVHGYQRPGYESPTAPPPAPEPVTAHEGATEEWATVLHELPTTAAGTNLQGQEIGSKEWWDAAGPAPDSQWWDEWVGQYTAELHEIGRRHQAAIDEAFGEIAGGMCRTLAELGAFYTAYETKAASLAAIDVHAAELVAS